MPHSPCFLLRFQLKVFKLILTSRLNSILKSGFDFAKSLQPLYNVLVDRVANDDIFLKQVMDGSGVMD
jgi:hypothetical protein